SLLEICQRFLAGRRSERIERVKKPIVNLQRD
uniref:Calcium/calmodulin-dependent protein kinase II association-domain domain-containing protein n=1 Tax=Parascaris univalens TaxID=6257 RepID=A0A915AD98_PARUN